MDDQSEHEEQVSALLAGAIGLHEFWTTLQQGGFTAEQATDLVAAVITRGGIPRA